MQITKQKISVSSFCVVAATSAWNRLLELHPHYCMDCTTNDVFVSCCIVLLWTNDTTGVYISML